MALASRLCIVVDLRQRLTQRAARPIRAEGTRFDTRDANAQRLQLGTQRIGPSFSRVLGSRVVARAREANQARDRADVDDVAATLARQPRLTIKVASARPRPVEQPVINQTGVFDCDMVYS